MSTTVSAWQDAYFEDVSELFDELWGWELDGSKQQKRDIADLYIAGALLACNRLRVVREQGKTAAFLGSILYDNPQPGLALENRAAFERAAIELEARLRTSCFGMESIVFNEAIVEANRRLKEEMIAKGFAWQGELKLLMTSSAFQGRGYARILVEETLRAMYGQGVRGVVLYTDTHCNWRYYEKNGWVLAAQNEWIFRDEPIRALAYWKEL